MREEYEKIDPSFLLVKLWKKADDYVWMSTDLNPSFYQREEIRNVMSETASRISDFRLILGKGADWDKIKRELPWFLKLVKSGRIQVKRNESVPHWMIVDGKHFRLEKEHPEGVIETSNLVIWDAKKSLVDLLQSKFKNWWDVAASIR